VGCAQRQTVKPARAVAAINRGDRVNATALAGQVLAVDGANAEAEDLLAAPTDPGEIRRLTIFFADLVDSTVLPTRVEPETYRLPVGRYREQVLRAVKRYGGHIGSTKGDFEVEPCPAALVKGVEEPVVYNRVVAERAPRANRVEVRW
jgi:class 3 adenylate cyclase